MPACVNKASLPSCATAHSSGKWVTSIRLSEWESSKSSVMLFDSRLKAGLQLVLWLWVWKQTVSMPGCSQRAAVSSETPAVLFWKHVPCWPYLSRKTRQPCDVTVARWSLLSDFIWICGCGAGVPWLQSDLKVNCSLENNCALPKHREVEWQKHLQYTSIQEKTLSMNRVQNSIRNYK